MRREIAAANFCLASDHLSPEKFRARIVAAILRSAVRLMATRVEER